ncbi:uncharacterized protein LOC106161487, partial [Lingula anatina]|uniref:Protoheme IX farnesyltransferase, mitochondrial n=1 Tax=Lingula anatina TaxID=7574 RepID=A0A1S3I935_LINAN
MYHIRLLSCGSSIYMQNLRPLCVCSCLPTTSANPLTVKSSLSSRKVSTATKTKLEGKAIRSAKHDVSKKQSAKYRRTVSNLNVHKTDELSGPHATLLSDNKISLFIKKSKQIVELDLDKLKGDKITLFRPKVEDGKLMNLDLADVFGILEQDVMFRESEPPPIESADEVVWKEQKVQLDQLLGYYLKLSKIRLTTLIVITTVGGYFLAPGPFDPGTLFMVTAGTGLMSGAANAMNQFFEIPYDSQMNRTKNRVLVRGHL